MKACRGLIINHGLTPGFTLPRWGQVWCNLKWVGSRVLGVGFSSKTEFKVKDRNNLVCFTADHTVYQSVLFLYALSFCLSFFLSFFHPCLLACFFSFLHSFFRSFSRHASFFPSFIQFCILSFVVSLSIIFNISLSFLPSFQFLFLY